MRKTYLRRNANERNAKPQMLWRGWASVSIAGLVLVSAFQAWEHRVNIVQRAAAEHVPHLFVQSQMAPIDDANSCRLANTSELSLPELIIDKKAIRAQSRERLHKLKEFTILQYERFLVDEAGKEHYSLWHYLTKNYHLPNDCRHVVDIGTRYVASALALGATGVPVKTFDIPGSNERKAAFRGQGEERWQDRLKTEAGVNVTFYNLDLLKIPDNEFREYMSTWLIILDTYHEPYSHPFERQFLDRLLSMEPKFAGLLLLDDINFNNEMRQWWTEVKDNADQRGYKTYDLTSVGHHSGTGLVDFSGKVRIQE